MKSLIIITIGFLACWYLTVQGSDSVLRGVLAAIGVVVFLIALAIWLVLRTGLGARTGSSYSGGSDLGGGGGD